jgi:hypothetical protein
MGIEIRRRYARTLLWLVLGSSLLVGGAVYGAVRAVTLPDVIPRAPNTTILRTYEAPAPARTATSAEPEPDDLDEIVFPPDTIVVRRPVGNRAAK